MGEVFLGAKRGPRDFTKLVVIKRLHPRFAEDPVTVEMFLDEARLAARLSNPHVVQTYEVVEAEDAPFLAMEYLEGQTLARVQRVLTRAEQPMPLAIAVRIFLDVLEGLHHAHTLADYDGTPLHVVHRDVTPDNVLLTYDGHAKVLDFGVARARTHVHQTLAGIVKGKLAYLAPEVARSEPYDHRADLWGLGIVMWEALAGERLFKADSDVHTVANLLHSDIRSLEVASNDVPAGLAAIVSRALERDPERRYRSAARMKEDLETFAHDAGLRASRAEIGAFVSEFFTRERDELRRILSAHMREELARAAEEPIRDSQGLVPARATNTIPPPPAEKKKRPPAVAFVAIVLGAVAVGALLAFMTPPPDEPVAVEPAPAPSPPRTPSVEPAAPTTPPRPTKIMAGAPVEEVRPETRSHRSRRVEPLEEEDAVPAEEVALPDPVAVPAAVEPHSATAPRAATPVHPTPAPTPTTTPAVMRTQPSMRMRPAVAEQPSQPRANDFVTF